MCGERKGEEEREERMKGSGGQERKEKKRGEEKRRRGERRETSWPLPISFGMCGPEPSGPVSGVEERENSVG